MTKKIKLLLSIWIFGMFGVLAVNFTVVPDLLQNQELPFSMEVAVLLSTIQSALLLLLASWGGSKLAGQLGLGAPALEAFTDNESIQQALKPQLLPGFIGGIAGAIILVAAGFTLPSQLNHPDSLQTFPLVAKLLYGGITEEIFLRWGVMSFLLWIVWWVFQKKTSRPKINIVVVAIILSSILFALGHIPAATLIAGESLTGSSVVYVLVFNSLFGIIAGLLFWRYGLEAAIIAHFGAHLFSHYFIV